jgi:hypothetical protein
MSGLQSYPSSSGIRSLDSLQEYYNVEYLKIYLIKYQIYRQTEGYGAGKALSKSSPAFSKAASAC